MADADTAGHVSRWIDNEKNKKEGKLKTGRRERERKAASEHPLSKGTYRHRHDRPFSLSYASPSSSFIGKNSER